MPELPRFSERSVQAVDTLMPDFFYLSGDRIQEGDRVLVNSNKPAVVKYILESGSGLASQHGCPDSGGFMLSFDSGGLELWMAADEDLDFISRSR